MGQYYKYLTTILVVTAAIVGPILIFIYKTSPPAETNQAASVSAEKTSGEEGFEPEAETPIPPERRPVRMLALGDVMLGRAVRTMYEKMAPTIF